MAELHSSGRIPLYDAKWLYLRLGQLSENASRRERTDWLGCMEGETGGRAQERPHDWTRDWNNARFRHQQFRAVANRQSLRTVFGQLAGGELQTRHLWRGGGRSWILSAGTGTRDYRRTSRR